MKIAVMGYGTVGSGVVKTLKINSDSIAEKCKNGKIEISHILDIKEITDENAPLVTKNFEDILLDDETKVVVETMGGIHPAYEFVSKCLKAGKSVVTSNKELVAEKGLELMKTANEYGVLFEFEASVAGGIPVIRAITDSLNSNEITGIAGIINGTTNFILTKMIDDAESYDSALKTAQEKGYAEKDPTADVEGLDAGRKICILSALAFGKHIYPSSVYTEGITKITLEDVSLAEKFGYTVKLIARAEKQGDRLSVAVSPALIRNSSPLASVKGVNNAVLIRGNAVGEVMFYGPGAGMMPTASAVVSDVIDCCNKYGEGGRMFWNEEADNGFIIDCSLVNTRLFVRTSADEKEISKIFGNVEIHKEENNGFITEEAPEGELMKKLKGLPGVSSVIRVSDY